MTAGTDSLQMLNYGQFGGGIFEINGTLDEMRVEAGARGVEWFLSSYNNQYSPSTFYSIGSPIIPSSTYNALMMMGAGT
jgi:hypothetical protein